MSFLPSSVVVVDRKTRSVAVACLWAVSTALSVSVGLLPPVLLLGLEAGVNMLLSPVRILNQVRERNIQIHEGQNDSFTV